MTLSPSDWSSLPVNRLDVSPDDLDLPNTFDCGQAFRWRRFGDSWVGVVGPRVYRVWRNGDVYYQGYPDADCLTTYFRLDFDLGQLRGIDHNLDEALQLVPGLRVLAQPALETLLTFVCTPANNIIRITRSIDLLSRLYGEPIATLDGEAHHSFPILQRLADTAPGELLARTGLGFRGNRLRDVAQALLDRGETPQTRDGLLSLPGIGPKVADCIRLFGLRNDEAVPVDTHVAQIARAIFPGARNYEQIVAAFHDRYGSRAGWAQQYLFHAQRVTRSLRMPSEVALAIA